jgi:hypothetical protein
MNLFGLQMNNLSENLAKKIPPTDSRLRPDVQQWEHANLELASKEKSRLETNQRKRRNQFKEENKSSVDIKDERTYYNPKYFIKTQEEGKYFYRPNGDKYWEEREKGEWKNAPRIFEDDCEPFY